MRRLRYNVAMSLDGYIAGPNGEYDWITPDPGIDFGALFEQFDTFVMGRKTFETVRAQGTEDPTRGQRVIVVSSTLRPDAHPEVTVVPSHPAAAVAALKAEPHGKDIWLFGGGALFRTLLDANLVDTVEVAVMPIMLGGGVPMLPGGWSSTALHLDDARILASGIVMLTYSPLSGDRST